MTGSGRRRLDQELVRRGLVDSREEARNAIAAGLVLVAGAPADKPARLVAAGQPVVVTARPKFVSRGGDKLDAALTRFAISVDERRCLDAGASTGGFTDCLLQRGARQVWAVDVGHGQLHPRIRDDVRVCAVERTNIRTVGLDALGGEPFQVVVADLSFIALSAVARRIAGDLAEPGAPLVVLVKPQFEAGRVEAARGKGVIREPAVWREALGRVALAFEAAKAAVEGATPSPVRGTSGNQEFFLLVRAHAPRPDRPERSVEEMLDTVVAAAPSC